MRTRLVPVVASIALACCSCLLAWNGHEVTEYGLRVLIPEVADVEQPDQPTAVAVVLANEGQEALAGTLRIRDLVDAWRVVGPDAKAFKVAPGAKQELQFQIVSGRPVYAALYPVHAYADLGDGNVVHAVRIFGVKTAIPKVEEAAAPKELPVLRLAPDGALALWRERDWQIGWKYYEGEPVTKPVRWQGSDQQSRASASQGRVVRGDARASFNMHPPWIGGGGSVWVDYRVALPETTPIRLRFGTAIRDHSATEPGSDGVLFRVYAFTGDDPGEPLFTRFSDAKKWEEADVDLSALAGKTVTLRLEAHPGPNHNTSCDSCYWGEPLLAAGKGLASAGEKSLVLPARAKQILAGIAGGQVKPDGRRAFLLEGAAGGPHAAAVIPGTMGLLDGWFLFADGTDATGFSGLRVEIEDLAVGASPAAFVCSEVRESRTQTGVRYEHRLSGSEGDATLVVDLRSEGPGLRVDVSCDRRISLLGVNPWDQAARRVYWGHGYVIDRPQAFRSGFGGHSLAASHVAFETAKGLAVLVASANPPKALEVDPATHVQSLNTSMNGMLTFVPARGGMNTAIAYRPLYDKQPAGGVKRLAGRYCFDIWGGSAAYIGERMQEAIRYGLVDSFLTIHNWQRWGYDYRLPDIWPPRAGFGTVEELRAVGDLCRAEDIPWGLHDNYIDFYPDADDYSYEDIYFTSDGQPHKAWHNKGREAYSYKWRPDRILPFVKRNFEMVKDGVAPTHSFLDVFTSTGCVEWWDWDGNFHSSLETRKYWGETFAWIREYLGDNAPTTSEAGHDQLTGYLDGADCQWITLAPKGGKFLIGLQCGDWERVPWGSAVTHSRFIQHGVGYSSRYEGGRSREVHGINSDDYLSMEALSGHALMTDSGCWGRAAVRKYYLLQDLARRVALHDIVESEFVGGDIHRQRVLWDEGTEVFVNRGESDWSVDGHVLPTYGFLARKGDWFVAVEKKDGAFAESARGESGWFCDARTMSLSNARRVFAQPRVENVVYKGGNTFTYDCVWRVTKAHRKPWRVFVHFSDKKDEDAGKISFQNDHDPAVPTEEWEPGEVRTPCTVELPIDAKGTYNFAIGLYSKELGRAGLDGEAFGGGRILAGTLAVERDANGITGVQFVPSEGVGVAEVPATNPAGTIVDFGFAKTAGACRIAPVQNGLRVTPLPNSSAFGLTLRLAELAAGATPRVTSVTSVPLDTSIKPSPVSFRQVGGELTFDHAPENFAYDIRW
jgi:hypothetical protein